MANKGLPEYTTPYDRLGSFIRLFTEDTKITLYVVDGNEENSQPLIFSGTITEMHEYAEQERRTMHGEIKDRVVDWVSWCPDGIHIGIGKDSNHIEDRNQLAKVGDLLMIPPQILYHLKIRDLMILVGRNTQVQIVTETAAGSIWKTIYRGIAEEVYQKRSEIRSYADLPIRNVTVMDGYLTIAVKDPMIT